MKEKLYTIPVNEAYDIDCECPLCYIRQTLEEKSIDFTMGPSYMEDDVRELTDEIGFCSHHVSKLYNNQNRLGLALMLKTHMDKTIKHIESLNSQKTNSSSIFRKKKEQAPLVSYINTLEDSCFICNQINNTFERYIATIFTLYKSDSNFREKFNHTKGYCTNHYALLYDKSKDNLRGQVLESFIKELNTVYLENFKRVRDDLDWFIDKFDYRFTDAPWKNSKDALIRTLIKTNGTFVDDI